MIKYATRLPPGKPVKLLKNDIVRKTVRTSLPSTLAFIEAVVKHFIAYPDPMVVPVYTFKILPSKGVSKYDHSYQYDMMRLGLLSQEERNLIDYAGDLQDSYGVDTFRSLATIALQGNVYQRERAMKVAGSQQDYPVLFQFLKTLIEQDRYHDTHSGNIMMDMESNYRVLDLEGYIWQPLDDSRNDWIKR